MNSEHHEMQAVLLPFTLNLLKTLVFTLHEKTLTRAEYGDRNVFRVFHSFRKNFLCPPVARPIFLKENLAAQSPLEFKKKLPARGPPEFKKKF